MVEDSALGGKDVATEDAQSLPTPRHRVWYDEDCVDIAEACPPPPRLAAEDDEIDHLRYSQIRG